MKQASTNQSCWQSWGLNDGSVWLRAFNCDVPKVVEKWFTCNKRKSLQWWMVETFALGFTWLHFVCYVPRENMKRWWDSICFWRDAFEGMEVEKLIIISIVADPLNGFLSNQVKGWFDQNKQ